MPQNGAAQSLVADHSVSSKDRMWYRFFARQQRRESRRNVATTSLFEHSGVFAIEAYLHVPHPGQHLVRHKQYLIPGTRPSLLNNSLLIFSTLLFCSKRTLFLIEHDFEHLMSIMPSQIFSHSINKLLGHYYRNYQMSNFISLFLIHRHSS